jgi:hypothetical protein
MIHRSRLTALLLAASGIAFSARAQADPTEADKAASRTVFAKGKEAMAANKLDEACPAFEESQRIWATAGGALNVGACEEQRGNLATAYGAYSDAVSLARKAGDGAREEEGARRAKLLEPRLSMLVLAVPPASRIVGLVVTRDGHDAGPGQWGIALPVDPGDHTVEATAPGRVAWKAIVRVESRPGSMTVDVPALGPAPPATIADNPPSARSFWSVQRGVGLGIGAVGVVGIVIGSVFGAKAMRKNSESDPHCIPSEYLHCDSQGIALGEDAFKAAGVSTAGFILGGAGLVGGTIVFLTAPSGAPKSAGLASRLAARPMAGSRTGGLLLSGEW